MDSPTSFLFYSYHFNLAYSETSLAGHMSSDRPALKASPSTSSSRFWRSMDFTAKPVKENDTHYYAPELLDDHESGVALAAWGHSSFALVGLGVALLLQGALLGVAIYITRHPILRPTALPVFSTVSLKSFNVIVIVIGSVIAGMSAYGISVGARSYLSHKLVTEGATLASFEQLFAIGQVGLVRKFSLGGLLPLVMFALASSSSSALVGVFTAATEHQVLDFPLYYVGYAQNLDLYSNNASLRQISMNSPQDFEAFPFRAGRWVSGNISTNETRTAVDGTESTPSSGFLPIMYAVSAFTAASKYYTDIHKPEEHQLSSLARWIIGNATDDAYTFAAPVATASTTCGAGTMTATVTSNSSKYIQFDVKDSTCGTTSYIYENLNSNITGTYSCIAHDGTSAYTAYFNFLPTTGQLFPEAQCTSTAGYGDGTGITYRDADVSYKLSTGDRFGNNAFQVRNVVDASQLAISILQIHWYKFFGLQSSPGLTYFQQSTHHSFIKNPMREWELFTTGTLTMALAKVVNTETYQSLYQPPFGNRTDGQPAITTAYYTELSSTAVWIGPRGFNRLWLVIIGSMFIALLVAFILTARFRPVTLNPLNPVSVLLVAQNSPMTPLADGGCLGDPEQVRAKQDTRIRLRAANNQHLAFHWGTTAAEPPVLGRMYG